MVKIAIIGAGISGLTLANKLKGKADVTIFEKSRGFGGRVATRHIDHYSFDHGAQFFTARTESFKEFLQPMLTAGVIAEWNARFAEITKDGVIRTSQWTNQNPHYVGVPGMNTIGKFLAEGLNINLNTKVNKIRKNALWDLYNDKDEKLGSFDWVILTAPAAQTYDLIPDEYLGKQSILDVYMSSCFSLMLGFEQDINLGFDAALVRDHNISWISRNNSKNQRKNTCSLLIHSTNKWADDNIDNDREEVIQDLLEFTSSIVEKELKHANCIDLMAWRYANISKHNIRFDLDETNKLAVCGDWCIKGRIESAYISANKVYKQLLHHI